MIAMPFLRTADRKSLAASRVGGLLVVLSCLCAMLCATTTSPAAAAGQPRSFCASRHGCTRTAVLAHTSDSEAEELEGEELQEGSEEAATAEVEAEEAEDSEATSPTNGANSAHSVAVSHLQLTARATAALARRLPAASAVAFSFTLSATADVHVTIVRQTSTGGRKRWDTLPDSLTLSLTQGHVARSLRGRNHLSPGRYRLTVNPTGGHSRSIYLSVQP
jgi:hypothetical protein